MKLIVFVLATVLILSVTGVYCTWRYAALPPSPQNNFLNTSLVEFIYRPEEVLPGDEENVHDENHLNLIGNVMTDMTYGLNQGSKPILHKLLASSGIVYCEQHVTGGQIKKLLIEGTDAANVRFVMTKSSDTEYIIYTYSEDDCSNANLESTEILTYKTVLSKNDNGEWKSVRAEVGFAQVFEPNVKQVDRAVKVSTWRRKTINDTI
jgi:hypothetical protein